MILVIRMANHPLHPISHCKPQTSSQQAKTFIQPLVLRMYYLPCDQQFHLGVLTELHFCQFIFIFLSVNMSAHTSFISLFVVSSSRCAPKSSAEWFTDRFLVAWPAPNLLITLPASPPTTLFWFEQTLYFRQSTLYYFEFQHACTCSFPMIYLPFLNPSVLQKGSAEQSTHTILVVRPASNLPITLFASPLAILFLFQF